MLRSYVITDITAATMAPQAGDYGLVRDAAIVVSNGLISWIGPASDVPSDYAGLDRQPHDGRLVTPALIDCHTHIVHGGNRAREFEMRLNGASYEEIARSGGGIVSTVGATRAASEADLLASALPRVDALISQGVSMIEVKSGYGLDVASELKMLRVARALGQQRAIRIATSFLGAHAVPKGMDADTYIDTVCLRASLWQGARIRITGQAARRTTEPYRWHGAGRKIRCFVRRSRRICDLCRCCRLGRLGHCGRIAAWRFLHHSRNPSAARSGLSRPWRANGRRHGLESGIFAARLYPARDEHGLHAVSDDPCRGPRGHDMQRGARPWADRLRCDRDGNARRSSYLERR